MCVTALDPFPTVIDPEVHRPAVGSPLTLECDPPHSYPPGNVYWGDKSGPQLRPLDNTNRVSLDYQGPSSVHTDLEFCEGTEGGGAEGTSFDAPEAPWGPLPPAERSGQSVVPPPELFKCSVQNGPFFVQNFCMRQRGHCPVPPPKSLTLTRPHMSRPWPQPPRLRPRPRPNINSVAVKSSAQFPGTSSCLTVSSFLSHPV